MEKILVPVDGSEQSVMAAQWASRLVGELGGSVSLLHVHALPGAQAMAMSHMSREQVAEIEARHAQPSFERARAAMGMEPLETLTVVGDPGEEIVFMAHKGQYDHIVMGSRGLTPLRELVLGSVSEHVIRKSHCPVTIVR